MNTITVFGTPAQAPEPIKIGSDFFDLHQQNLETRCKIAWDKCNIGDFIHVPFNKSKSKPSIPERLKKLGWQFTASKHDHSIQTYYNGQIVIGWVFQRIR